MLSIFPQLLSFQIVSFALLRLVVAAAGIMAAAEQYKKSYKILSVLCFITSIFLFIGLYTQIFALLGIILVLWNYYADRKNSLSADKNFLYIVLIVILISLLFTGPGFLAIDKPL
jgi:uncharacterized membrane protein YphA (DoxX/SURF4 family)